MPVMPVMPVMSYEQALVRWKLKLLALSKGCEVLTRNATAVIFFSSLSFLVQKGTCLSAAVLRTYYVLRTSRELSSEFQTVWRKMIGSGLGHWQHSLWTPSLIPLVGPPPIGTAH